MLFLHLAANSNLNKCEMHPAEAFAINVSATQCLAELANTLSIPLLFTSSDMVFDGKTPPYQESDLPTPINVYGQQKVKAEQAVLAIHPQAIICRLPLLYGYAPYASNFLSNWHQRMKKGEAIQAFTDEFRNPLSGRQAAKGLKLLVKERASGIWHLGGRDYGSRYEFAIQMAKVFGLDSALVKPSLQSDVQLTAKATIETSISL